MQPVKPPQSGSQTAPACTEKSQYQHFIPRLILRGFAQDSNCAGGATVSPGSSKKQRSKAKKASKDGVIHFIRTNDGTLGSSLLSRHYGLEDMYRDMDAVDQNGLEKKLALLENQAGDILANAKRAFLNPGVSLTMTRSEKDTLRKFLFVMKYRNSGFFSRFDMATIDEYIEDDKESMSQYMKESGFKSPRQVWLANMHAFLDLRMDPDRKWKELLPLSAYRDDALLFILHVEQSYVAFCKPRTLGDEFLLTDNVFGIFEGPNSFAMNPATGELSRGIWTEWHNFAPVSSTLLVLLRSNYLPGNVSGASIDYDIVYRTLLAMHPSPERAGSILQELPVRRCATSYSNVQNNQVAINPGYQGPSPNDKYTFECFELDPSEVNMINSLFLEEAIAATSVTYKSTGTIVRAIRTYLEDPRPGIKVVEGDDSERRRYLIALETALRALGGIANTVSNNVPMPLFERPPLDYATHMTRWVAFVTAFKMLDHHPQLIHIYRSLGGSIRTTRARSEIKVTDAGSVRFLRDIEQGGKILFLHIKIDSALSDLGLNLDEKIRCRYERHKFFFSLHPRYVWLYIKFFRNLDKFSIDDFYQQTRPLEFEGPEDGVIREWNYADFSRMSEALLSV